MALVILTVRANCASIAFSLRRGPIECPKQLAFQEIENLGADTMVEEDSEEDEEDAGPAEEWPALPS
jgi:hypothetical protein